MDEAYQIFLHICNTKILHSDMNSNYGIQKLKINMNHNRITFTFTHTKLQKQTKLFTWELKKISMNSLQKQELNTLLHKWTDH
jgi:hypothetical protein